VCIRPSPPSGQIRVLIADDDRMFAELLRSTLVSHDDVEVIGIAKDGLEALDIARDLEPDLLVMDVGMPRVDGIEATRRVTDLPRPPRVILITGADSPSADNRAFAAGASAYLRKSNGLVQLMDLVVAMAHVSAV
jgi:DNA-binding NarL/FixJ family response regulator